MSYDRKARSSDEKILKQFAMLSEKRLADVISEYTEDFVGILNKNRQYVVINERYFADNPEAGKLIGKRPGEVFNCIHSGETEFGCGNSVACGYCDAASTIIEVLNTGRRVTRDGHLLIEKDGNTQAVDVRVTGIPYDAGEPFVLLFIKDVSREKRVELLERAFFHDVLNTSNTLSSLIALSTVSSDVLPDADRSVGMNISDIVEQIQYYQKLKFAEAGELCVEKSKVSLSDEVGSVAEGLKSSSLCNGKQIELQLPSESVIAITDRVLYRRIVLNLIKNALEASREGDAVTIKLEQQAEDTVFSVQNSMVMPESVRTQIFQRSFSTKGPGRGIGTYSVKLLGERYLGGSIDFFSDDQRGTVFIFRIPRR